MNYVEVQAMFGTVITCFPVARKRKARVGIAGRQLCLKPGLFWAIRAVNSADPVLKKQPQKHLLKKMIFHSTASDRHKKSKQVPAERLLCTCVSSRSLQNKLRDNKIPGACRNYYCLSDTSLLQYLPYHQHDAPQGLRGNLQR